MYLKKQKQNMNQKKSLKKDTNLNSFFQSKKGKYSLISLLVLSVLLISGLFTYNLLKQDSDTAKAANTTATAFNPSDCATYTSNGGTNTAGVCFVKMYEKNGQLYRSLDIAPGELVNVRNYYNNTTTASVTAANITDSMPANFTRVGAVTNSYVDATPVTLNNNVFTGQNLSVAPGAGYFGYGVDNTLTSSNLELGKKRYLAVDQCNYTDTANADNYSTRNIRFSSTLITTTTCNISAQTSFNQVATLFTAGNRYITQGQCNYYNPTDDDNYSYRDVWEYDNTLATTVTCASVTPSIAQYLTNITSSVKDSLGGRYLHQNQCNYARTRTNSTIDTYTYYDIISIDNTLTATANCDQNAELVNATVGTSDLSDTTRGHGYISYSMQAPTSGLTNGQQVGTTGTLNAGGAKTSGTASSLTITNVSTPNITYTKLYSVDGGSTWSPTVSANPGQSVLVRLWNENTGGISSASANIKDSLPNTFTYVAGSAKNCLNPSTTTITSPDNTELVCDSGTAANKDTLFSTLTNASGVSPSAGLYDAAGTTVASGGTAYNAVAGVKDIGKMRYLNTFSCVRTAQPNINRADIIAFNAAVSFANTLNTILTPSCVPGSVDGANYTSWNVSDDPNRAYGFDTLGDRYIHGLTCTRQLGNDLVNYFKTYGVNNNSTETLPSYCAPGSVDNAGYTNWNNANFPNQIQTKSTLGNRYLHYLHCIRQNPTTLDFMNYDSLYSADNLSSIALSVAQGCTPGEADVAGYVAINAVGYPNEFTSVDTLDATRSKSYIQYEMIIPAGTAGGNYGTQSTISSTATTPEFTSVNSGTNGSGITVTGDPAFSVKKLLALPTSGTGASAVCPTSTSSYSTTLSNTPAGSTICVRLAYQNKTNGAVSNAAITDNDTNANNLIPNGNAFTYIPNTTINCLTPASGDPICNTDSGMGGAIPNSVWDNTPLVADDNNVLNITPHAGFYGQASNSATGIMEMGKKRYAFLTECQYTRSVYQPNDDFVRIQYNNPFTNTMNSSFTCPAGTSGFSLTTQPPSSYLEMIGKRYLIFAECQYLRSAYQPNDDYSTVQYDLGFSNSATGNAFACPAGTNGLTLANQPANESQDSLGGRYLAVKECQYIRSAYQPNDDYVTIQYNAGFTSNTSITYTCPAGLSGFSLFNQSPVAYIDTLDPNNGTGYIQYKMLTPTNPTTSSITLPNVTLAGDGQTTSTSAATINFSSSPLTTTDIPSLTVTCGVGGTPGTVRVNTTTTCTFTLPTNKTLPNNFKLGIGNATPAGTCTVGTGINSSLVTCINVPTGTLLGTQPINGQIGTETITPTGETVNVIDSLCSTTNPCALFETALTYSPTQALAKRYGASGSTNSDNLILTLKDTRLEQSGFTTTCSIKYKFRTDTSYRILTTNSTYNNTTGCTGNLLKANQLLFNVDFEITAITTNTTTNTTKNYLIYSNYDFKAGSIGVTSIGGSGL